MTPTRRAITLLPLLALPAIPLAQQPPDTHPGRNNNGQPTPDRAGILTLHTGVQLVLQDIPVTDANGPSRLQPHPRRLPHLRGQPPK